MNTNSFDLKELQDTVLKYAKDHPFGALLFVATVAGISKGISSWGPHIERVGKYAVDKVVEHLPKPAHAALTDDSVINANIKCQQAEAIAT